MSEKKSAAQKLRYDLYSLASESIEEDPVTAAVVFTRFVANSTLIPDGAIKLLAKEITEANCK